MASCPRRATILGTEGPDVVHGTPGNDLILGGLGSDPIEAGGGNDIVFTGGDGSSHPSTSITRGGPGNDIILSDFRHPSFAEYFYGDQGSDLLWPNPLRLNPLGNVAIGGSGNNAIILLDGLPDSATMGDLPDSVKIPLGENCSVSVPLPQPLSAGGKGKLSCTVPIDVQIPASSIASTSTSTWTPPDTRARTSASNRLPSWNRPGNSSRWPAETSPGKSAYAIPSFPAGRRCPATP